MHGRESKTKTRKGDMMNETIETLEAILIELRELQRTGEAHFLLIDKAIVDRVITALERGTDND